MMDGLAATLELRRLGFQMPIIAATATYSSSERELCVSTGMVRGVECTLVAHTSAQTDVIAKPFTKQTVLAMVRRHLQNSAPRSISAKEAVSSLS